MKFAFIGLAAFAIYVLYKKGFGSFVGQCPSGYSVVQDMFPTCRNNYVIAADQLDGKTLATMPANQLAYPMVWGWNGNGWVAVQENL